MPGLARADILAYRHNAHVSDEHRHPREIGVAHAVTPLELFFDLVFVFAVTQLSHTLAGHLTAEGLLHTTMLMLAVWWAWMYTTWATNWCDPDYLTVRVVLVGIMLGGLIMAASIPEAFDGRGLGFAAPYVAIQVGRTAFLCYAGREDRTFLLNFTRITTWLALAGVFWIAGALALFLVGYSLFKRAVLGRFFPVHLVALAALAALFVSHPAASPVALTIGTTVVLVARWPHAAAWPTKWRCLNSSSNPGPRARRATLCATRGTPARPLPGPGTVPSSCGRSPPSPRPGAATREGGERPS